MALVSSLRLLKRERLKNEGFPAALVASGTDGRVDMKSLFTAAPLVQTSGSNLSPSGAFPEEDPD